MTEAFIEKQFPVSKVSKESYKERRAGNTQTLTGLGKWWGRKPLILVRAAILGSLMPSSDNPKRDMEIFQKILSMDNHGLYMRKEKSIPVSKLYEYSKNIPSLKSHILEWFDCSGKKIAFRNGVDKKEIEDKIFSKLSYDEKLQYCMRPEHLENLDSQSWKEINHHFGTSASNLWELTKQLSEKQFGHNVVIGDCFSGGGSIPFEAARIGCNVYASDLNPLAGLLTWAGINLCGSSKESHQHYSSFLENIYNKVNQDIINLGIEENEVGDRALSYIYCIETTCPECGQIVPLIPDLTIGKGTKTIVELIESGNRYDFKIISNVTDKEINIATKSGTIQSNSLKCPHCGKLTPISRIRKDKIIDNKVIYGLRHLSKNEFEFNDEDVYHERLYAIRYQRSDGSKYYCSPSKKDLQNEEIIKKYISQHINEWQDLGIIPNSEIESGFNTDQLTRERGWAYWHHLFNPRQLLINGLFVKKCLEEAKTTDEIVVSLLAIHRMVNSNSALCIWDKHPSKENGDMTFYNQALNTIYNHISRSSLNLKTTWFFNINNYSTSKKVEIKLIDARNIDTIANVWITDPPYADAVNYHELSEFFLAWDKSLIKKAFPNWYSDTKRILAVKGDEKFADTMIEIYSNLANHMPNDGIQIVMFTHSDSGVWAQLALIMWSSGLKVTAAWNITTETDTVGLKTGNYVKGTVLLVLRKQMGKETAFLNEINDDIKSEVKKQIQTMQNLDDKGEPNFSDPDYVLAAYAASLKVLTSYKYISGLNIERELNLAIENPEKSKIVKIIENAKKTAYDCIIPTGFDSMLWKELSNVERFYIKGLESEKSGNYQVSTYQEYARGFSITNYKPLMADMKANSARFKTPMEFAMREVNDVPQFEDSLVRKVLASVYVIIKEENEKAGLGQLRNTVLDYWNKRDLIKEILSALKDTKNIENMKHWQESATASDHLYTLVENDHI